MIDREELVNAIYYNTHFSPCPNLGHCKKEIFGCKECASEMLSEYENEIYNQALDDFLAELRTSIRLKRRQ